jgi:hypothetical protein
VIGQLSITISNASGPQGRIEVIWDRWDGDRPGFQYRVDADLHERECLAYGHDLRLGSGSDPSHVKAMATLLAFLESDAEKYRAAMSARDTSAVAVQERTGDSYSSNEATAEWAYELSDELTAARLELEPDA